MGAGGLVGEDGSFPVDSALNGFRVGIDEELGVVETLAAFGIVRAGDAIAVKLAGLETLEITVPDGAGGFFELVTFDGFWIVGTKQAEFYAVAPSE